MSFEFAKAPAKLIGGDGRPAFGVYAGPIAEVNLHDFAYQPLRRFPWTLTENLARKLIKKWQFVGVVDDDFVFGSAVIDLGYISSVFAYVFDRQEKILIEVGQEAPFGKGTVFAPSVIEGVSCYQTGSIELRFENTMQDNWRRLHLDCGSKLKAQISYQETGTGVTTVSRVGVRGFNHCYKMIAMPAKGEVTYSGQTKTLTPNALALIDWTTGTPNRETYWNWACGSGKDMEGRSLGINFACGLNETGHTENSFWVNGQPEKVDVVSFAYDHNDMLKPWRITSMDGKVDLTFQPDGERLGDKNYLFVVSRLHQPFGHFQGTLKTETTTHNIDTFYGFTEEHYAKW